MEVIVIESKAYYKLQAEQFEMIKCAVREAIDEAYNARRSSDWVTFAEAKKILPYKSKSRWQELRDRGDIVFSKFGRKILYSRKSLNEYITKNLI